MTKFQKLMQKLDEQAGQTESRSEYWQSVSLLLAIWSSGGIPAPAYDPRVNILLAPFYRALGTFGEDFRVAVNARAFPI